MARKGAFSKTNQPSLASREKQSRTMTRNRNRSRAIKEILEMTLSGSVGESLNDQIALQLGKDIIAQTLLEGMTLVQVVESMKGDTTAFKTLLDVAGISKPFKVAETDAAGNDLHKKTDAELLERLSFLKKLK